jgi:KAP family P-loop domain
VPGNAEPINRPGLFVAPTFAPCYSHVHNEQLLAALEKMSHSDNPLTYVAEDTLDRRHAVSALHVLLTDPRRSTPLVVGVYGGWGTGKTSVMRMLRRKIEGLPDVALQAAAKEQPDPGVLTLWFDSWKYARQEQSLWRALLLEIIESLRAKLDVLSPFKDDENKKKDVESKLDEARQRLYRSLTIREKGGLRVNWWGGLPLAADAALTVVTAGLNKQIAEAVTNNEADGVISAITNWLKGSNTKEALKLIEREASERYAEEVQSLEQFQKLFNSVLEFFCIGSARTLFVFVDDLDRCMPDDAVSALEAIKLFLDLPGCVFVLGMDRVVVEQGIRQRYKEFVENRPETFKPGEYLDKIIQIPFNLPPLGGQQILHYLNQLGQSRYGTISASRDLIEAASPPNPRSLKRVLNVQQLILLLDNWPLAELDQHPIDDHTPRCRRARLRYITKLVLLQTCFEDVYRTIVSGEFTLHRLEAISRKLEQGNDRSMQLLSDARLIRLFEAKPWFGDLSDDERQQLLTLSTITASD